MLLVTLLAVALGSAQAAPAPARAPNGDAAAAPDRVDALLATAQATIARGDYRAGLSALEPLTRAATLSLVQHARLYQLRAAAHSQVGADDVALSDADVAERDARAAGAFDLLARIESVRGVVAFTRGRSAESLAHFQQCVEWAKKSGQPALIAGAYTRVASAYQDMGDWTRALDAVNRAHEAAPQSDPQTQAQYLTRKGLIEIELHDGASARASMEEALRLAQQSADRRTEAQVLDDLALLHERVDRDLPRAIGYAEAGLALARDLRVPPLEIGLLNQLGALLRETGRLASARDRLAEALRIAAADNEHRDEPYVLKNLGQVLIALGATKDGEARLREAAAAADRDGLTRVRWLARLELAQLHATDDPAAADAEFANVLAIVEQQQANVLLEGFRAGALDETLTEHDPYDLYVRFLLGRGDSARAFAVAERQRARAFLDTLSSARDSWAAAVPAGYAEAETALLRRLAGERVTLASPADPARRSATAAAIEADERALVALRLRLAAERPALADARYPVPWSLADLQRKLLRDDEHLVAYFLGADRSVAWSVDRSRVQTIVLPGRRTIEDLVRPALAELRDPAARGHAALDALARALRIDQIVPAGSGAHLIVVPHGVLFEVPFEALPTADGRLLVERVPVAYAPSVSSLAFLTARPPVAHPSIGLLAVGNPSVAAALPHTHDELRAIGAVFRGRSLLLEGGDATVGALRQQAAGGVRMLHFATHGLIDESRPDQSGLVLTPDPPRDDGLLQMRDIYATRIDADLVTLSACETALGRNVTGEGVIGLSRAFFYSGARAVVSSLWDVEDAATARLMTRFYDQLRQGQPIDVALQQAKLSMIHGGDAAPFYWAAFVASGRVHAAIDLPPVPWRERLTLPFVAAAAVSLGLLALRLRRRRVRRSATAAVS